MNLKKLSLFALLISSLIIVNCSSDDNLIENPTELINEFIFENEAYSLTTAWVYDENTTNNTPSEIGINLFNKSTDEINSGNNLNNIHHIYFDFNDVQIQETTYNQITDYDVSINGSLTNGVFDAGTVLLSDSDPQSDFYVSSGYVTINNITENTIDLAFRFTRVDGQIITGYYSGSFIVPE